MTINELIEKLFGDCPQTESLIIDRWRTYELPAGYATTLRLETLYGQFTFYGQSNTGEKLIVAGDRYVIIKHPPLENRKDPILLSIREDNLRPCFLNDMSEEEDFENNRKAPKLAYGYIWREQVNTEVIKGWRDAIEALETTRQFKDYEADVKSWTLIESTMLNKQDTIPQIRNSFKPGVKVDTENGLLITFPSGFIAFDKYGFITIAMDFRVAKNTLPLLDAMRDNDGNAMAELMAKLSTEIMMIEGSYFAFDEVTLETALLSSIGNSI